MSRESGSKFKFPARPPVRISPVKPILVDSKEDQRLHREQEEARRREREEKEKERGR